MISVIMSSSGNDPVLQADTPTTAKTTSQPPEETSPPSEGERRPETSTADFDSLKSIADSKFSSGQFESAACDYRSLGSATTDAQTRARLLFNEGLCLFKLGRSQAAGQALRGAVAADGGHGKALRLLARCEAACGEFARAKEIVRQLARLPGFEEEAAAMAAAVEGEEMEKRKKFGFEEAVKGGKWVELREALEGLEEKARPEAVRRILEAWAPQPPTDTSSLTNASTSQPLSFTDAAQRFLSLIAPDVRRWGDPALLSLWNHAILSSFFGGGSGEFLPLLFDDPPSSIHPQEALLLSSAPSSRLSVYFSKRNFSSKETAPLRSAWASALRSLPSVDATKMINRLVAGLRTGDLKAAEEFLASLLAAEPPLDLAMGLTSLELLADSLALSETGADPSPVAMAAIRSFLSCQESKIVAAAQSGEATAALTALLRCRATAGLVLDRPALRAETREGALGFYAEFRETGKVGPDGGAHLLGSTAIGEEGAIDVPALELLAACAQSPQGLRAVIAGGKALQALISLPPGPLSRALLELFVAMVLSTREVLVEDMREKFEISGKEEKAFENVARMSGAEVKDFVTDKDLFAAGIFDALARKVDLRGHLAQLAKTPPTQTSPSTPKTESSSVPQGTSSTPAVTPSTHTNDEETFYPRLFRALTRLVRAEANVAQPLVCRALINLIGSSPSGIDLLASLSARANFRLAPADLLPGLADKLVRCAAGSTAPTAHIDRTRLESLLGLTNLLADDPSFAVRVLISRNLIASIPELLADESPQIASSAAEVLVNCLADPDCATLIAQSRALTSTVRILRLIIRAFLDSKPQTSDSPRFGSASYLARAALNALILSLMVDPELLEGIGTVEDVRKLREEVVKLMPREDLGAKFDALIEQLKE